MTALASAPERLPRRTLILAGAVVLFALTATSVVRIAGVPAAASPAALRAQDHVAPV